ncbi:MAG: helix-turn-helix transcriptional regulator [Coriobacteriia bacterium]|nr:helix-turn-helix transcriptional regulator [Coriobacteriia bacterium]
MYDVGARLRILRKERGETLEQVADATGLSIAMLSRVERGERLPSPDSAEALAAYFGLPPEELLGETIANQMIGRYGGSRASAAADHVRRALSEDPQTGAPRSYGDVFREMPIERILQDDGLTHGTHHASSSLNDAHSMSSASSPQPENDLLRRQSPSARSWEMASPSAAHEAAETLETAERVFERTARDLDRLRAGLGKKDRYLLSMRLRQTAVRLRDLADSVERD